MKKVRVTKHNRLSFVSSTFRNTQSSTLKKLISIFSSFCHSISCDVKLVGVCPCAPSLFVQVCKYVKATSKRERCVGMGVQTKTVCRFSVCIDVFFSSLLIVFR